MMVNNEKSLKTESILPEWFSEYDIHPNSFYPLVLFDRLMNRVLEYQHSSHTRYDLVIKLRPDIKLKKSILKKIPSRKTIFVQRGNIQPNDWILIGSSLDLLNLSKSLIEEVYKPSSKKSLSTPPHGFYQVASQSAKLTFETHALVEGILRAHGVMQWGTWWRIKNKIYERSQR